MVLEIALMLITTFVNITIIEIWELSQFQDTHNFVQFVKSIVQIQRRTVLLLLTPLSGQVLTAASQS